MLGLPEALHRVVVAVGIAAAAVAGLPEEGHANALVVLAHVYATFSVPFE